ncbi:MULTISPECIES: DMT family transporter [unclassified Roseitalea]|uniref:DMT family transporter n=1 Tax=unclassified Roseitalea TaxID=2639107 RepID=UPI00273D4A1E|nr:MULTISPECIES: DMT family transporter [unclassified Roseitalea]
MQLSANLRASAFMALSMAGLVVNDALVKTLGGALGIGQIMFVRGAIIVAFLAAFVWLRRAPGRARDALCWPVALRTFGEVVATILFLNALFHMPLANATAVLQALPLVVALGAALFLGEPVGWRRFSAIAVGFAGVMLIVRPGFEGFNAFALFALGAVFFAALRDLATRMAPAGIPSLTISLITAAAVAVIGLALIPVSGGWRPMTPAIWLTLAAAAGFLFIGYHFVVMAMRVGEIGFVAPFRYTSLLWAIIVGIVVFGDFPDALMLIGSAIVVATGIYTLHRERVTQARLRAATHSAESAPSARGT